MAKFNFPLELFGLQGTRVYTFPDSGIEEAALVHPVGTRENPTRSYLGNLILGGLGIEAGNYKDRDGRTVSYGGLTMDYVLMSVTQQKNIVVTQVAGAPNTVKELISAGDYKVKVMGALVGPIEYPTDAVERLSEICQVPAALSVVSEFLTLFGIDQVVIESFTFKQTAANENLQAFELSLLSDAPIELTSQSDATA